MRKAKPWLSTALAICLVFCMFGGTALGAPDRYAVVTEVVGDVTVTKAGGALSIPVFTGMTLQEGDRLSVGKASYVVLKTADRGDEIVIGENWRGTLSRLRVNGSGGTDTAIKMWSGSLYNAVQKSTDSASTFKVETPGASATARGTHFMVAIDPKTGLPKMIVNAGRVDAGTTSDVPVLPGQQVVLYPSQDPSIGVDYIDPDDIVVTLDPEVINRLLQNKALIDAENGELLDNPSHLEDGTLSLEEQEALERYRQNVENMLIHILRQAAETGKLTPEMIESIIETVNQQVADEERKFSLDVEIPEIDRTAGVDKELEEQRRQQREEAQREKEQRQQQREQKREDVKNNNSELLERIEQRNEEQSQANREAEEEKRNSNLDEEQKQILEEKLQQRKEEAERLRQTREQQTETAPNPTPAPPAPSSPAATTTTAELSDSAIAFGQTFTITAEVHTASSQPVPDGGTVVFRIGEAVLGSGTIEDGSAALTVDEELWTGPVLSGIQPGRHTLTANYAGTSQYASSTSAGEDLDISAADTVTELTVAPEEPLPGDILTIDVTVSAKAPGSGSPSGTVILYRLMNGEWEPAFEPVTLQPGEASVSFEDSFMRDTGAAEMQYKAEFVSADSRFNDSESDVLDVEAGPKNPAFYVKRTDTEDQYGTRLVEIYFELANFTGDNAIHGAELKIRHNLDIYDDLDGSKYFGEYNEDKFGSGHEDEHSIYMSEAYDEILEQQYWPLIYRFEPIDPEEGMTFTAREYLAKIALILAAGVPFEDVEIELIYWQFIDKDGNPISVNVYLESGIMLNPIFPTDENEEIE